MVDYTQFSKRLLEHPAAANERALERVALGKRRVQSVLDRETIAHQKTLEQKISEQGPIGQRVDPHIVGLAVFDLLNQNRLKKLSHVETNSTWYSNPATPDNLITDRLNELAPLYDSVTGHGFGNLTGDALELIVFKCLDAEYEQNNSLAYQGSFQLAQPKDANGRYRKVAPPKHIGKNVTTKEPDFLLFGHASGPLCIECKNYRQWTYPHEEYLKTLIIRAYELSAVPILVARRIHYTAISNFLAPAGIISHETYFQYYPADKAELAEQVRHKRSLGFTDVLATEVPHARTTKFFAETLPKIADGMGQLWRANRDALLDYACDEINLAQLYTAIGSPAGGKWKEPDDWPQPEY